MIKERDISNNKFLISIIILFLYVPLLESYFGSTLWGLKWYSPELMDRVGNYLIPLKMLSVAIGLLVLARNNEALIKVTPFIPLNAIVIYSSYLIGCIQLILLALGLFFSSLFSSNLSYVHKEKTFEDYSIYVHTSDPGAMGKAYHYFYIKCSKPFGRYELTKVKVLGWMRKFDFEVKSSELLIFQKDLDRAVTYKVDLTKFNQCHVNES